MTNWAYLVVRFDNPTGTCPTLSFGCSRVSWDAVSRLLVVKLRVTNADTSTAQAVKINDFTFIGTYLSDGKLVQMSIPVLNTPDRSLPAELGDLTAGASALLQLMTLVPAEVTRIPRYFFQGQFSYGGNIYYF